MVFSAAAFDLGTNETTAKKTRDTEVQETEENKKHGGDETEPVVPDTSEQGASSGGQCIFQHYRQKRKSIR